MRFIPRSEQDQLSERASEWRRPAHKSLTDSYFDGRPLPTEIAPRHWKLEGDVHDVRRISRGTDSTRYFTGPHVTVLRDDMRRVTWAAVEEKERLVLSEYLQPARSESERGRGAIAEGGVWRYHISLNKFTGQVVLSWIMHSNSTSELWHDGSRVETSAADVDFPFFAFSQVPIGLVQRKEPDFGVLGYKCRATDRIFCRRWDGDGFGPEQLITDEPTVGGISFAVVDDLVLGRIDLLRKDELVPALVESTDSGRSYEAPRPIDLSAVGRDFVVRPGFQRPIVDKGGTLHVTIGLESSDESLALNYMPEPDILVEAIRVKGRLRKAELEVFPSTLGGKDSFGNGVSDGHGLIMTLSTTNGHLFSSNSSAGGIHFPESSLLNHEMPLVAAYSASECYSSGLLPNFVSMDYLLVEANSVGHPISSDVYIETWDMPLPVPRAEATADGNVVRLRILNDADLEPGKVTFGFDDPSIHITDVQIHDLRSATIVTDSSELRDKTLTYDVLTLFHRHYGEARVS